METSTKIIFLRHGQCEGGNIFRGDTDVPLNDIGYRQMQATFSKLSGIDHIITSPKLRCHDIAKTFSTETRTPLTIDEDWKEISFGAWEGKLIEDIQKNHQIAFANWLKDPVKHAPPESEDFNQALKRVTRALNSIFTNNSGKTNLVVAHGGVIRIALCVFSKMPIDQLRIWQVDYASASCIARFAWQDSQNEFLITDKVLYQNWLPELPNQ